MGGTKAGGKKAATTNMKKHGKDFYKRIGAMGGRNGHTGGFAANPELAKIAGAKGGKISKRGKSPRDENGNVIHTSAYTTEREHVAVHKAEQKKGGWKWPFWGRKSE